MGQSGTWDVDGTGIQTIEDSTLAAKIRDKVNSMNKSIAVIGLITALVYAVIPSPFGKKV